MRILILAALAAVPSASMPAPTAAAPAAPAFEVQPLRQSDCARRDLRPAGTDMGAEMKRLDELPPGDLVLAVYNEVDGCMEPVIVSHGVPRPQAAPAPEPVRPRARLYPPGS